MVLLCQSWRHCRHGGGLPAVLCDVGSVMAFVAVFGSLGDVILELVAAPRSSVTLFACEVSGHNPKLGVVAPAGLDGL